MAILNYTTQVDAHRTAAEVTRLLARHGASAVVTRYDGGGSPAGVSFELPTPHGRRHFTLPVDVNGVHAVLAQQGVAPRYRTVAHARNVAWRIVKDWLAAQLAMVDARLARLDEVMLPYLHVDDAGTTLYAAYRANEARALAAGGDA